MSENFASFLNRIRNAALNIVPEEKKDMVYIVERIIELIGTRVNLTVINFEPNVFPFNITLETENKYVDADILLDGRDIDSNNSTQIIDSSMEDLISNNRITFLDPDSREIMTIEDIVRILNG